MYINRMTYSNSMTKNMIGITMVAISWISYVYHWVLVVDFSMSRRYTSTTFLYLSKAYYWISNTICCDLSCFQWHDVRGIHKWNNYLFKTFFFIMCQIALKVVCTILVKLSNFANNFLCFYFLYKMNYWWRKGYSYYNWWV
jgi:hypothetical protein